MSESDANKHLADTARLRMIDGAAFPYRCAFHMVAHDGTCPRCAPLEDTQPMPVHERRERMREGQGAHEGATAKPRERRKPSTVGERRPTDRAAVEAARDIFADRQQELIEAKLWPQY